MVSENRFFAIFPVTSSAVHLDIPNFYVLFSKRVRFCPSTSVSRLPPSCQLPTAFSVKSSNLIESVGGGEGRTKMTKWKFCSSKLLLCTIVLVIFLPCKSLTDGWGWWVMRFRKKKGGNGLQISFNWCDELGKLSHFQYTFQLFCEFICSVTIVAYRLIMLNLCWKIFKLSQYPIMGTQTHWTPFNILHRFSWFNSLETDFYRQISQH